MIAHLKPYPRMKYSGVPAMGDLPEHWNTIPLKRWVSLNGQTLPETTDPDYEFQYLDIGSVGTGVLRYKPVRVRFGDAPSRARRIARPEDTIVSTVRTYLKAVYFFDADTDPVICSTGFAVLSPQGHTVPKFVSYVAQSNSFTDRVTANSVGIAYPAIAETRLGSFHVPVPPFSEQAAIVLFLDHVDRRIRRYVRAKQKLITLLDEQVAARASEAIRHPSCATERLANVVVEQIRPVIRDSSEVYVPLGLYNRGRGLFHKVATPGRELGDSTFSWVEPRDLIISGQFAWEGAVALASAAEDRTIVSHRYYLLRGVEHRATTPYLWALFRSDFGAMLLDHHSRGAAGRNRPLNLRTLLKEPIPVPPYDVQLKVNELVEAAAPVRSLAAAAIKLCLDYRTRVIADVLTGKLDVREAANHLPNEVIEEESLAETDAFTDLAPGDEGELEEVEA